jgi:hypothetical protein
VSSHKLGIGLMPQGRGRAASLTCLITAG